MNPTVGSFADCCARAASGHATTAPEQRDEFATFQLIEWHSTPAARARLQDIELARNSQEAAERFYTC
jgi:hypothetical protein